MDSEDELRIPKILSILLGLETLICSRATEGLDRVVQLTHLNGHASAARLLREISAVADRHHAAVTERLRELDPAGASSQPEGASEDLRALAAEHPLSNELGTMQVLVARAITGYATLQPISHRLRDSWVVAERGTTAHIARAHTQEYVAISGEIMTLLADAARGELEAADLTCQCSCPACGFGICVCATGARRILSEAWAAARPAVAELGVPVSVPRPGSAAQVAGLQDGDVIAAVDGVRIDAYSVLQAALFEHAPGDRVRFKVRRGGAEFTILADVPRTAPDDADACMEPAGREHYRQQALEIRARLRATERGPSLPDGERRLASLSVRQLEVLRMIAEGATNPAIAARLGIKRSTVANHVAQILAKLGVANRVEAASYAIAHEVVARR